MMLYELKRGDVFTVDSTGEGWKDYPITFDHIDGMYSVCYNEDKEVIHLSASTPVIVVDKT